MKLSTGKVAFPIEFDNGEKTCIYFNPNDPELAVRLKDFQVRVEQRMKDIGDVPLKTDGMPLLSENSEHDHDQAPMGEVVATATGGMPDETLIEAFRKLRTIVDEEIDVAFGAPISAEVFKYCSPFAIVNGDYFVMQFVEAILPEIEKEVKQANASANAAMQKHIAKYVKK